MRFLKLTLAYDGTNYAGWQWQLGHPSVQATLQDALRQITGEAITVVASGRTDAGVHALGQVVSLATASVLPCAALLRGLNAMLPHDIAVLEVTEAPHGFHATWHAVRKRYRYVIQDSPVRDVFALRYAWYLHRGLDERAMQAAAAPLVGEHDFTSFEGARTKRQSAVRTIYELTVAREAAWLGSRLLVEIEANGFLYNMVRIIVGSLVRVGQGAAAAEWLATVLAARDRKQAGPTAPAEGLFLVRVDY